MQNMQMTNFNAYLEAPSEVQKGFHSHSHPHTDYRNACSVRTGEIYGSIDTSILKRIILEEIECIELGVA